jgi:hypothetical protein
MGLKQKIRDLENELEPLALLKQECDESAKNFSTKMTWLGLFGLCAQVIVIKFNFANIKSGDLWHV